MISISFWPLIEGRRGKTVDAADLGLLIGMVRSWPRSFDLKTLKLRRTADRTVAGLDDQPSRPHGLGPARKTTMTLMNSSFVSLERQAFKELVTEQAR